MEHLHAIGGTPVVLKHLLNNGYLHGDVLTVTGRTLAENLEQVEDVPELDLKRAIGEK